jgi:hypothetical protein
MSEQLNAEMQRQSNIHEISKLLQNWEQATSHVEQGHAVALNHIGNQEVLSRLSQEFQSGDFSELTNNALAVLGNMYEEARQSAQERAKGMIQQDADVITNDPGCNMIQSWINSINQGSLEVLAMPGLFDQVVERLCNEEDLSQTSEPQPNMPSQPDTNSSIPENIKKVWTESDLRQAVGDLESMLYQQGKSLETGDLQSYDRINEERMNRMEEIQNSLPKEMHGMLARLLDEQYGRTEQYRIMIGNKAIELRKK